MPKDKEGNKLTWSQFLKRWGKGIKQVATNPTPLEKLTIELRATFINLIGIITCLTALIIFREQFFVSWFAYGLILIFVSTLITTLLKFFGLKAQKKFLKSLEVNSIEEDDINKLNKEFTEQLVKQEEEIQGGKKWESKKH